MKDHEFIKVTLRLHRGDTDIIQQFYPHAGYNKVIRQLVHKFARQLLERDNKALAQEESTHG